MEIWLVYLVKILLLPLSSLLFIAFFGFFYQLKNGKGKWILFSALLTLLSLSLPFVAVTLGKTQEKYPTLDLSSITDRDTAIVVIGGGIHAYAPEYNSNKTVNSRTYLRLRYTAYLSRKTQLPILVSGGNVFNHKQTSEADLMAAVLRSEFHVPVKWLEKRSRNTSENALFSHKILRVENINSIVLVTHAMHMARAVEQFERVGFKVFPAPTVFLSGPAVSLFNFLPSENALKISSMAIHEWLGGVWYRIRYSK